MANDGRSHRPLPPPHYTDTPPPQYSSHMAHPLEERPPHTPPPPYDPAWLPGFQRGNDTRWSTTHKHVATKGILPAPRQVAGSLEDVRQEGIYHFVQPSSG